MNDVVVLSVITAVSIGAFLVMFWLAGIVGVAKLAITTTRHAVQTMRDPKVDELEREKTVQTAAVKLVVASGSLILRSAFGIAVAFVPVLVADWAEISPKSVTLAFMERWDVIMIASLSVTLAYVLYLKLWPR